MFSLIAFSVIIAVSTAHPVDQSVSVTQDTLGNYKLKYAIEGISRVEHRDALGNVNGGFSYIDPHGILRKTEFTSGVHGYNAIGTDIPVPVQDTPEVAHAKAEHLSVLRAAELAPKIPEFQGPEVVEVAEIPVLKSLAIPAVPVAKVVHVPIPSLVHIGAIPDTPEVIAARIEHLAAHEAAKRTHLLLH